MVAVRPLPVRALWLALAIVPLAAQECRITAITPAQPSPKVEEGERARESQTFQTSAFALSPANVPHFFDTANRIRRIEANGRVRTVAGAGYRAEILTPGPALDTSLPTVSQIVFSPEGVLHFTALGRVWRVVNGAIEVAAGSGRPGFNGEAGPAAEVNLGNIVNVAFAPSGALLILDGYNRVRLLESDGILRTIAGSARAAASTGFTGDNGPATEAALSSPRQIVPLRDGSLWIKDLSGRHLRLLTPDGAIRTINQNFEASVNILLLPDGTPAAATSNRVYPIRPNGTIETGANPFPPFTGTPLAVGSDGALFFLGSARPEQRNPLVRLADRVQTVIAGAPVAATVDGQAPPFGIWQPRTNSLLYATSQGGKSGIVEARAGQAPRFVVGGGDDVADADGKAATSLTIFGIVAFSIDGEGRIAVADVYRRRILVVGADGKVTVLKTQGGEQVVYAPTGSLSALQRIAADNTGNIYWYSQGATPAGGVFTAEITVWARATSTLIRHTVEGLSALARLEDGSVAVIAGNGANFRTAHRLGLVGQGAPLPAFRMLPLQSVTRWRDQSFFTAASRLFRGEPGRLEMLDVTPPPGGTFVPDFVLAAPDNLLVHLNDGGFYRIDNLDACKWLPQPSIAPDGIVNAASFGFPNTISPRQLTTVFGSGLGPPEGQGMVLDGVLRATGQPAPYPALVLGNFSGAIPNATLSGTTLPVVYSNDRQVTVQALAGIPASGQYLLYFSWQGLQLIHPAPIKVEVATPGLFAIDGLAVALNEDGIVQLFGTGFGALSASLATGEFFGATPPQLVNPVSVTIGGLPAQVEFAGGAPGMIGGMYRIDVRVPEGLAPGPHPVLIEVEGQPASASLLIR
ncbi:MAG: hypothetical protein AAB225_00020 [Acidobacteriota bacterium]